MCIYNIDIVLVFKMPTIHDGLYIFLSSTPFLCLTPLFSLRSPILGWINGIGLLLWSDLPLFNVIERNI